MPMQTAPFSDNTHKLLGVGGVLEQAETALKQLLASQPDNRQALWRLGEIGRGRGNFAMACEAYRRLLELSPDHQLASYLLAVLSGHALPAAPRTGPRPAPFVRIAHFLSPQDHMTLLEFPLTRRAHFVPATLGGGRSDPEGRSAWVLNRQHLGAVAPRFVSQLTTTLAEILPRLDLTPFAIRDIELQLTAHLASDFYKVHRDNDIDKLRRRRISFVYYFHHQPRRFSGGDLLLHDTDMHTDTCSTAFTRIEPEDNSLIVFPSRYYHQITPVCTETNDLADGRLTLNGWVPVHTAERLPT